jgi:hypothetical protein
LRQAKEEPPEEPELQRLKMAKSPILVQKTEMGPQKEQVRRQEEEQQR